MDRNKLKGLQCVSCITAATKRASLTSSANVASKPFELIHTEIPGLINLASKNKKTHMDVFLDEHTRMSIVNFVQKKSEFFEILKGYEALAENEQAFRAYTNAAGLRMLCVRLY